MADKKETPAEKRERQYQEARRNAPENDARNEAARKAAAKKEAEDAIVIVPAPPRGDGVRPWVKWTNPDVRYKDQMPD